MKKKYLPGIKRFIAYQSMIGLLITAICFAIGGASYSFAGGLGALVSILPNALFARQLFQHSGARAAKQIVNAFYKAEGFKILLSLILFIFVIKYAKPSPGIFFTTYILVQMVYWFAPWIINYSQHRPLIK